MNQPQKMEETLQYKIEQYYKHWVSQGRSDAGILLHMSELATWVADNMKMEGEKHKLTPFQETVNTYLENRAEELGIIR
jgi:nicotinamide riboside kinase